VRRRVAALEDIERSAGFPTRENDINADWKVRGPLSQITQSIFCCPAYPACGSSEPRPPAAGM